MTNMVELEFHKEKFQLYQVLLFVYVLEVVDSKEYVHKQVK